jgi:hypothetical protein
MKFVYSVIVALLLASCGGGGTEVVTPIGNQPPVVVSTVPAFEELWEPRTEATGVFGYVWDQPLVSTPDGSDPQTGWINQITGKWGTLGGQAAITGIGPNKYWSINQNRLYFHGGTDAEGYALISGKTFDRTKPIVIETDVVVTSSADGAFVGLALIAGEADYREVAIRRNGGVDYLKRNTPLRETLLAVTLPGRNVLRLEYDPIAGFRYMLNGQVVGTEAIDHEGASFAHDPSVGLYITVSSNDKKAVVEGSIGTVRVWTSKTGTP